MLVGTRYQAALAEKRACYYFERSKAASAAARHDLDILRRWKALAYQSGVLIVGYSYGYFAARDLVRMGACLTVVEFLALLILVPFYWPLIGLK